MSDVEQPPKDLPVETIIIVACVCGAVVVILTIILIVLCCRRYKINKQDEAEAARPPPQSVMTNIEPPPRPASPTKPAVKDGNYVMFDKRSGAPNGYGPNHGNYPPNGNQGSHGNYPPNGNYPPMNGSVPHELPPQYDDLDHRNGHRRSGRPGSDRRPRKKPSEVIHLEPSDTYHPHGKESSDSGVSTPTPDPTVHKPKKVIYEVVV